MPNILHEILYSPAWYAVVTAVVIIGLYKIVLAIINKV
jgi:hypothetical protein